MKRRAFLSMLGLALAGLLPAQASSAGDPTITVFAAASLTEALQTVAAAWTAQGNPRVTLSFDASSRLARQIEAGAPADAFFSADEEWMSYLDQKGLIREGTRVDLLGNSLVVVVPASSTLPMSAAGDLARPEVRHLALAGESVPAGRYARAALTRLGVFASVADRVVSGDNVRSVLAWVATGEAEAGVVYATDARVDARVRAAFTFPADSHPPIVYPAALVAGSRHGKEAAAFLAFCASPAGMALFSAAGFSAAPATPR